jgi:hypothetical protein
MSELPKGPLTRDFWEIPEEVADPQWAGRRKVSEATRRVAHKVVVTFAPPEVLDRAAALINEAAALLEGHPEWSVKQAYEGGQLSQSPQQYADRQSIIGRANPFAPPLRLRRPSHSTTQLGASCASKRCGVSANCHISATTCLHGNFREGQVHL